MTLFCETKKGFSISKYRGKGQGHENLNCPFKKRLFLGDLNTLRWGWVFLERTRILSGIQFTTYFIEIFVMEMKRFVGSFVNVILTRQTCGQRSSRAAESKHRPIGN